MQPLRGSPTEWRETWQLAVQALRANKVRAMLTMLGVIIGSACIVLVVTVALAGKRYIIGEIEGVGANLVYASVIHSGAAADARGRNHAGRSRSGEGKCSHGGGSGGDK